ncbi:hypothetical protein AVEN_38998-1 [Araneus ventricosus]|uniref:Uncharacterized protein n=1 Tax=Araneus ventricosus TaxID=182803 RepID=A0A4Y2DQC6_ARAVE|nr:hypothetical protein AVEN_38998-1 [Araneus ventricosus]
MEVLSFLAFLNYCLKVAKQLLLRAAALQFKEQLRNCVSQVIGMRFDTKTTNSGRFNGACTFLEQKIDRNFLWIACRHHMFEVLLSDGFSECFGKSTGLKSFYLRDFEKIGPSSTTMNQKSNQNL